MTAELDRLDAERLRKLRLHWGDDYAISHNGPRWVAVWRHGGKDALLSAVSDGELLLLIRADYDRRTVPR